MGARGDTTASATNLVWMDVTTTPNPQPPTLTLQGWNSWCTDGFCNLVGMDVCNEALVRSIADAIVSQGMDKLGCVVSSTGV